MRDLRPPRDWFLHGRELGLTQLPCIDFQTHTRWTDGASSVGEMISAAEGKGLHAIALTEHVNWTSGWYPQFVEEVKAKRAGHDLAIYFGAEVAAADYAGGLKADLSQLCTELLLGVVHRLPKKDASGFWDFDELRAEDAVELEISALLGLTRNRRVDVLAHPGGTSFRKFGPFPVEWLEPVFCAARDYDVAVELNSKYVWDIKGTVELLRRCDPLVSFGSDAHQTSDVGAHLQRFRSMGEKGAAVLAV